jgi:glycosyltransferase involved in cell wall biosynthesis
MKVLHIDTGREWRGGQAQVYNLIKYLPDKAESHLLCPTDSPLASSHRRPLPHSRIYTHSLRGEWDISAAWQIKKLHRQYNFNLIHAHSSHALGIAWLASFLFDLPPYIETRRLELPVGKNFFSKKKYLSTDHHIAISNSVKESLVNSGIPGKNISIIPSGVDPEELENTAPAWQIIENLGLDQNKPLIGNVGALSPQKDQRTFIKAAAIVLKDHPEAQFLIAGKGELRAELEKVVKDMDISDNVIFAGFQENIIGLIKTFDLFVLTSIFEGLCSTLLQVMGCKIPIIASDVGGVPDLIENNKTGKLVPAQKPAGFAKEINIFLKDPESYRKFASSAKNKVSDYDYRILADKICDLYENLL